MGADIAALVDGAKAGTHHVVTGPRGSGKTSLAQAVVADLRADGWGSVTLDLFHLSSLAAVCEHIIEAAGDVGNSEPAVDAEDEVAGIGDAIALLDRAAAATEEGRVVLCIDSAHELATTSLFGEPDEIVAEIRSGLGDAPNVVCLFVGGRQTVLREVFESGGATEAGKLELTEVSAISSERWSLALRARYTRGGFEVSDAALDRLLAVGASQPHAMMLIASATCELANNQSATSINEDLVNDAIANVMVHCRRAHENELIRLRTLGKHSLPVALRVAKDDSPYKDLAPAIARKTLSALEGAGLVEHPGHGTWTFADPLFRRYLVATVDRAPACRPPLPAKAQSQVRQPTTIQPPAPAEAAAGDATHAIRDGTCGAAVASTDGDGFVIRHPDADESESVGQLVACILGSASSDPADNDDPDATVPDRSVGRLRRFIERTVAKRPDWYWQVEDDDRTLGGMVLYRPDALFGPNTPAGMDPLVQVGLVAVVAAVSAAALVFLVMERAWTWGAVGGLLAAALIACLVQALSWLHSLFGRARASWMARRHSATIAEGLWCRPHEDGAVLSAIAQQLPGTLLAAHVSTVERRNAYAELGFWTDGGGLVAGILDPAGDSPVHPKPLRTSSPRGR